MSDQEQGNGARSFHEESGAVIFDKPKSQEEIDRGRREDEQHEFARAQVVTNKRLAWFTGALVFATLCTIGVGIWQATISQRAANAAKSAADTAAKTLTEMQNGQGATDTHTLAQQAVVQAEQTTTLAVQAKRQADASKVSADAAKSSADIASETLNVSERAYIVTGAPTLDISGNVAIPVLNDGHVPSGKVHFVVHEATIELPDPSAPTMKIIPSESHWKHYDVDSIPVAGESPAYTVNVPLPAFIANKFNAGLQQVVIVGVISYNDGFAESDDQEWHFCDHSSFNPRMKQTQWIPCDWNQFIAELISSDHYPSNEYR